MTNSIRCMVLSTTCNISYVIKHKKVKGKVNLRKMKNFGYSGLQDKSLIIFIFVLCYFLSILIVIPNLPIIKLYNSSMTKVLEADSRLVCTICGHCMSVTVQ